MKKFLAILSCLSLLLITLASCAPKAEQAAAPENKETAAEAPAPQNSGKVMLYSSMKEPQLQAVKAAFEAKYPNITFEYVYASGGKLKTKMTTEAQSGKINADVVWLGDPSDYEGFKKDGYLQKYASPELNHIPANYVDKDGYYIAARLVTMGVAWNTIDGTGVKEADAPKTWNDFLDPKWKDQIICADPAAASTTKYWMACMMQNPKYGKDFFQKLKDNGCQLGASTEAANNGVCDGSYEVGFCLDYTTANNINEGSPIAFHYTDEDVVTMTSPVALIKDCTNEENGKILIDFILSKEGQEVLVSQNLVSVRDDVENVVDTKAIAAKNMEVDFNDLAENTSNYLADFNTIFGK